MSSFFWLTFPRSRQTCQQWLARSFSGHGLSCGARIRDEGRWVHLHRLTHCPTAVSARRSTLLPFPITNPERITTPATSTPTASPVTARSWRKQLALPFSMLCKIGTARGVNPTSASESAMDDAVATLTHQKGKGKREKPSSAVPSQSSPQTNTPTTVSIGYTYEAQPRCVNHVRTKNPAVSEKPIEMEAPWKPPSAESGGQGRVEIPRESVVVTLGWGSELVGPHHPSNTIVISHDG